MAAMRDTAEHLCKAVVALTLTGADGAGAVATASVSATRVAGQAALNATSAMADSASATMQDAQRMLLEGGAWYQNELGSVLNDRGVPISIKVHVSKEQTLQLKVDHLNSKYGGSDGWFAFNGAFQLHPTPEPHRLGVELKADDEAEAFVYDTHVLERATAFAFGCLKRVGGAVLSALRLEWDTRRNCIIVTPQARVIRLLWWEPVVLGPASAEHLWTSAALVPA